MSKIVNTLNTEVLFSEAEIQNRVLELADQINSDYGDEPIIAICILKGSFMFFTDVIKHLKMPVSCEFIGLSSYENATTSSGEVKITLDLNGTLEGKHVVVFEDIVDSGLTLKYLTKLIESRKPKSVRTCVLLMKLPRFRTEVSVDYFGFEVGNQFVVGYGIDYAQKYRGLPYIGYISNAH
jgi:hypoxanthine phosphoribosyltransferase